ncbi:ABC transporter substrate-binding protein [Catellatospora vulcania]|uniref:ABC transporter substrate-binding protein n=1 Tax=Catellatospora vulcania TaxID=1460450 RepID=UPI0012D4BE96|nr:ABC transporter substrate-binding protein [Catellatospora vulcania]
MSRQLSRRSVIAAGLGLATVPLLPAGRSAAADPPLRVGVLVARTGGLVDYGRQQLLGVQRRADGLNGGAGHGGAHPAAQLELLLQDVGDTPATAREAVSRLLDRGVHALVGPPAGWLDDAVAGTAQAACTPLVLPSTGPTPTSPYAFRSAPTDTQVHRTLLAAMTAAGQRAAGVLRLDARDNPVLREALAAEAAGQGARIVSTETVPLDGTALADKVKALLAATPEALLLDLPAPLAAAAAAAAKTAGWTGPVLSTPDAAQATFHQLAGEAAAGVRAVSPWLPVAAEAPEALPNWSSVRRFAAELGTAPAPSAGYAADAVTLLHQAFLGHRDKMAARDQLERACCVGVTGVFNLTADDHAGLAPDALTVLTSRAGAWTTLPPAP